MATFENELQLTGTETRQDIFATVEKYLGSLGLAVANVDSQRPWGGFFVIDETETSDFIGHYFPDLPQSTIEKGGKLSPKILLVEPGKRLSWQYHDRREELWKILSGPVGVITSSDDQQGPVTELAAGETIQFGTGVRHRLVGLDSWGVIAEIWQHTDPNNPSNEDDIVRVEDDFGR
ncbi:MAG: phosphoheptose isomerase [Candidatus Saccharimonadales bacterium]